LRTIIKTAFVIIVLFLAFILFRAPVYSKTDETDIPLESNPRCIASNPAAGIIVISNEKSDSISVADQDTRTVIATIPVGKAPKGTAIDIDLNLAVVANSKDDSVSLVDLNRISVIKTITVGKSPHGVAVNPINHTAVVANHKDNTVSTIDLISYKVVEVVPVGKEPIDVAIDPELGIGLVVNQKDYDVSIIDLNDYKVTGIIAVGQKPIAIDINPEIHIAAVANEKDNSITTINLLNWKSSTVAVGKHPVDIAVNRLDNRALVISDEDRSLLLIDLNTNSIIETYTIKNLSKTVAVNNLTNTAALADDKTDSLTLIQLPNPVPHIDSINPENILRGSTTAVLTIGGSGFIKGSIVSLQGISHALQTELVDNHSLRAIMPGGLLQRPGEYRLSVTNPSPEGGISNSSSFIVNNPAPSIFMLEPADALAGTQGMMISIYGTGLFEDTELYFGNVKKSVSYVNSSKLEMYLSPEDLKTPGQYEIAAYNPSPGGGSSNKLVFTIKSTLEVKISSPTDGETVNKARVMVKGTIKADNGDVGIIVNGVVADISGAEWVANNVPLTTGTNVITATVADSLGNTAADTITINTYETSQNVELYANITSGVAPLTTYFSVSSSFIPVSYQIDFEGDGVIDYTGANFEDISYTFAVEGIYYPTITITDAQGDTYSDVIAITVLSKTEMDSLLKEKWVGMKDALANGDIAAALKFISENSQKMYRYNFELMKELVPTIIQSISGIYMDELSNKVAKYHMNAVQDGEEYSFYLEFIKNNEGLWKMSFF
jgi:YVTN family beta-propeller protein